ncbi:MAG TPA: hypothetical protein VJ001_16980 [Rhodocyclaceae bacterium]|nr:hypothetical protein [Rhodocyclaceae bacterium]
MSRGLIEALAGTPSGAAAGAHDNLDVTVGNVLTRQVGFGEEPAAAAQVTGDAADEGFQPGEVALLADSVGDHGLQLRFARQTGGAGEAHRLDEHPCATGVLERRTNRRAIGFRQAVGQTALLAFVLLEQRAGVGLGQGRRNGGAQSAGKDGDAKKFREKVCGGEKLPDPSD